MDKITERERLSAYQRQVNDWIGEQGILFRLRHAGGINGTAIGKQLGALCFGMVLLALFLGVIAYVLLHFHMGSADYKEKVLNSVKDSAGLEECEGARFERSANQIKFKSLVMKGGAKSFFYTGDLEIFAAPASFLAGITEDWTPENLKIVSADLGIKAGGDAETMDQAFTSLIRTMDGSSINSIEVAEANFDWGYSKITYGRIQETKLKAQVVGGKWNLNILGGTFQQNWLKDFTIDKSELSISPRGIQVENLELRLGEGVLSLSGEISGTPQVPEFNLFGEFQSLPVEFLMRIPGIKIRDYISGKVSGNISISGSTNRVIVTKGSIQLNEGDQITLREKWHILKALSLLDKFRTYRKVVFNKGSFDFETSNGGLKFENVDLVAMEGGEQLISLKGSMNASLPSQAVAAEAVGVILTDEAGSGFENNFTDASASKILENERMSLKTLDGDQGQGGVLGSLNLNADARLDPSTLSQFDFDADRLKAEMNIHRVEGEMSLTIPGDSFTIYPTLEKIYPLDEDGLRELPLFLRGTFLTATEKHSNDLLLESRQ